MRWVTSVLSFFTLMHKGPDEGLGNTRLHVRVKKGQSTCACLLHIHEFCDSHFSSSSSSFICLYVYNKF